MIIFKPLLTPQQILTIQVESYCWLFVTEKVSMIWNVTKGLNTIIVVHNLRELQTEPHRQAAVKEIKDLKAPLSKLQPLG